MKRIYNYLGGLLIVLVTLVACKKNILHPSEGRIPLATDIDISINVDQDINQVTFTMNNKGVYPVWIFEGQGKNAYSTINKFTKIYNTAGTYTVEVKIGNANGISDGSITKTFTINNSLVDFDKYIGLLAGNESKKWSIARLEKGHLGCGPSGTDGLEWWSAIPNDKADWGLYDDVLTFTNDMKYTYNPGEGGTVYVNTGSTLFSEHNPHNEVDFMAPVPEQTTSYNFIGEGEDVFLTFPAQTLFPYIANDESYNAPKYKVVGISPNKIELVSDNGTIAWHYILSAEGETKIGGYDPDNNCNLWKTADFTNEFHYAPGWNKIADPDFTANGNSYHIKLPEATFERWQAQVAFKTNISTNAATNYDFSTILYSSKDIKNVTVKLVKNGGGENDNIFLFEEQIDLKANETYTFIRTNLPGIDIDVVKLVLDFGGNPAGTTVDVSRIVLKENSCNDGTIIEEPEEDNVNWLPDSDCNKWKTVAYTNFLYYAPGHTPIANPVIEANGNQYKVILPTETYGQWQAQVHFKTSNISTQSTKTYDFRCVLNSTKNLNGVTIKLTKVDDDSIFFFTKNTNLEAYKDYVFKMPAMPGLDIENINLVFDFGGNPANTEVTIRDIILKESTCNQ